MLLNPALWTSSVGAHRRYGASIHGRQDDSRNSLQPLPTELKYKAKPFADVAVDRLAREQAPRSP